MCLPQRKPDYRRKQSTIARTNILSDKELPVAERLDAQLSGKSPLQKSRVDGLRRCRARNNCCRQSDTDPRSIEARGAPDRSIRG